MKTIQTLVNVRLRVLDTWPVRSIVGPIYVSTSKFASYAKVTNPWICLIKLLPDNYTFIIEEDIDKDDDNT